MPGNWHVRFGGGKLEKGQRYLASFLPYFLFMPRYKGDLVTAHLGWFSAAEVMSIAYLGLFTALALKNSGQRG